MYHKYFLSVCGLPMQTSFEEELFNFVKSSLSVFSFIAIAFFWLCLKNSLLPVGQEDIRLSNFLGALLF